MKNPNLILKFLKWIGGAFEDQEGSVSSKRLGMYIILFFLYKIIDNVLIMTVISSNQYFLLIFILSILLILSLVLLGVIAKEFFLKYGIPLLNKSDNIPTNSIDSNDEDQQKEITN